MDRTTFLQELDDRTFYVRLRSTSGQDVDISKSKNFVRVMEQEYACKYLEKLHIQPTTKNIQNILKKCPFKTCDIKSEWNNSNLAADTIVISRKKKEINDNNVVPSTTNKNQLIANLFEEFKLKPIAIPAFLHNENAFHGNALQAKYQQQHNNNIKISAINNHESKVNGFNGFPQHPHPPHPRRDHHFQSSALRKTTDESFEMDFTFEHMLHKFIFPFSQNPHRRANERLCDDEDTNNVLQKQGLNQQAQQNTKIHAQNNNDNKTANRFMFPFSKVKSLDSRDLSSLSVPLDLTQQEVHVALELFVEKFPRSQIPQSEAQDQQLKFNEQYHNNKKLSQITSDIHATDRIQGHNSNKIQIGNNNITSGNGNVGNNGNPNFQKQNNTSGGGFQDYMNMERQNVKNNNNNNNNNVPGWYTMANRVRSLTFNTTAPGSNKNNINNLSPPLPPHNLLGATTLPSPNNRPSSSCKFTSSQVDSIIDILLTDQMSRLTGLFTHFAYWQIFGIIHSPSDQLSYAQLDNIHKTLHEILATIKKSLHTAKLWNTLAYPMIILAIKVVTEYLLKRKYSKFFVNESIQSEIATDKLLYLCNEVFDETGIKSRFFFWEKDAYVRENNSSNSMVKKRIYSINPSLQYVIAKPQSSETRSILNRSAALNQPVITKRQQRSISFSNQRNDISDTLQPTALPSNKLLNKSAISRI